MSIVNLNQPYEYERMIQDMDGLLENYPHILRKEVLGLSLDGREIASITIGKQKRCVLLTAGVHGRESVNPAVLMGMAEYYLEHYAQIRPFRNISLSIVPMVNPDGHTIALQGFESIRNEELRIRLNDMTYIEENETTKSIKPAELGLKKHQEWKYNARGIDINRNFPCKTWSSLSGTQEPCTEPETKAITEFLLQANSIGYMDYHSRGELIYYYRNQMGRSYNVRQKAFANELARITGYRLVDPEDEIESGDVGGNTVHFYSEKTGKPAITIETLPDDIGFPLPYERQEELLGKLYATPFILAKF